MINEKTYRSYAKLSIFFGLFLLLDIMLYQSLYTQELYVMVNKSFFIVELDNYFNTIKVFNSPIIAYFLLLILNAVMVIYSKKLETQKQPLKEVSVMNLTFTILLIIGQIFFVLMIPDTINGVPKDNVFFTLFPKKADSLVYAVNITYLVAFIYLVYNLIVVTKTAEPKEKEVIDSVEDEEKLLREFLKD
jgi:hypothetical protein